MTPAWIAVLVAGTVFAAANAVAAWGVNAVWPARRHRLGLVPPAVRARRILAWRLAPVLLATAAAAIVTAAFLLHEPEGAAEHVGVALRVAAASGIGLLLATALRVMGSLVASECLAYRWTRGTHPAKLGGTGVPAWHVDSAFPVVAVVGVRRPRLVVARSVVLRCSDRELSAIVAHERGHLAAADNLKRLVLQSTFDVLSSFAVAGEMTSLWQETAEDAADDHAAAHGSNALDLASALVAVARLAPGGAMASLPASTFYRGAGVERRVRRLLAADSPSPAAVRSGRPRLPAVGLACGAALALAAAGRPVYLVAEWFITHLP